MPQFPLEARADALNKLLGARRIKLFSNANNRLIYKEVALEEAQRCWRPREGEQVFRV